MSGLMDRFPHWLKEVHVETGKVVYTIDGLQRNFGVIAVISHQTTKHAFKGKLCTSSCPVEFNYLERDRISDIPANQSGVTLDLGYDVSVFLKIPTA